MSFKRQLLDINNNKQWEQLIELPGLIDICISVVDIYTECFGPCDAMLSNLKPIKQRAKNTLHLARAKSDNISFLEQFRDKSEPTWLFLVEGKIVNLMYGANAPKLIHLISAELKNEIAIKDEMRTRTELDITDLPKKEEQPEEVVKEEAVEPKPAEENIERDEELLYFPFGTIIN